MGDSENIPERWDLIDDWVAVFLKKILAHPFVSLPTLYVLSWALGWMRFCITTCRA
jgi:hypothetical protein